MRPRAGQPTRADAGRIDPPLRGVVVASPTRPGTVIPPENWRYPSWCDASDVRLISIEVYHGLAGGTANQLRLAGVMAAVVVNSFFKVLRDDGLAGALVPAVTRRAVAA